MVAIRTVQPCKEQDEQYQNDRTDCFDYHGVGILSFEILFNLREGGSCFLVNWHKYPVWVYPRLVEYRGNLWDCLVVEQCVICTVFDYWDNNHMFRRSTKRTWSAVVLVVILFFLSHWNYFTKKQ